MGVNLWIALSWAVAVLAAFFHTAGIVSAAHAVWNCRTSQGAIAWGLSLSLFPYLSLPAYWILGRDRFAGYRRAFREASFDRERVARHLAELERCAAHPQRFSHQVSQDAELSEQLESALAKVEAPNEELVRPHDLYEGYERLARFPVTQGNQLRLLIDGEQTFRSIFEEIEKARHYVYLLFFLIADDAIGRELKELLIRKAREGIKVYFVYDELGSWGLPASYPADLRAAGVHILPFYPTRVPKRRSPWSWLTSRLQLNFRNHRKITVVDGRVALVGGVNVHDDSLGRNPFYGDWRDTHVRIEGPAVASVQLTFLDDYFWASDGQVPDCLEFFFEPTPGGHDAVYVPSGPADVSETGTLFFLHSIQSARRRIWLATPYFVPTLSVLDALRAAVLRGVEVKVMIPLRWDLFIMYLAAHSYLPDAEEAGIEIYRYAAGHPHQKVMLVDDDLAWVGSSNLDARSMQLSFEGNLVAFGKTFAGQVEEMLKADMARCRPLSRKDYEKHSLLFKLGVKLARLFETVL